MASINYATREISCKIVYYGPGLSGKTTNLQIIHRKIPDKDKSEMVSLATETDRTLFFDFLPLDLGSIKGFSTKFQLYTVPGQVYYNATRKLVLRGVDGVVFVVDSQMDKLQENLESFANLQENLREYGHSIENIPLVLQYNKRDLPGVYSVEQLNSLVNKLKLPHYEAVAATGVGVFTTLKGIGKSVIDKFNAKYAGFQGTRRPARPGDATGAAAPQQGQQAPVAPRPPAPRAAPVPPQPFNGNTGNTGGFNIPQGGFGNPSPGPAPTAPGGFAGFAAQTPPAPGGFGAPPAGPQIFAPRAPGGFGSPPPSAFPGPASFPPANPGGFSPAQNPFAAPAPTGMPVNPAGNGLGSGLGNGPGAPGGFGNIPSAPGVGSFGGNSMGGFSPPRAPMPQPSVNSTPQFTPPFASQPPSSITPPTNPFSGPGNAAPPSFGSTFGSGPGNAPSFQNPFANPSSGFSDPSKPMPNIPQAPNLEGFGGAKPSFPPGPTVSGFGGPSTFVPPTGGFGGGQGAAPGGAPAGSPFGSPPQAPGPFGQPSAFGQGMNTGNAGFGNNAPSGFGSPPPNPPAGFPMMPNKGQGPFPTLSMPIKPEMPMNQPPAPGFGNPGPGGFGNNAGPNAAGGGPGIVDKSGIVSTYEDMSKDDSFKTKKLPNPSEKKKKGFFDGLFRKDK